MVDRAIVAELQELAERWVGAEGGTRLMRDNDFMDDVRALMRRSITKYTHDKSSARLKNLVFEINELLHIDLWRWLVMNRENIVRFLCVWKGLRMDEVSNLSLRILTLNRCGKAVAVLGTRYINALVHMASEGLFPPVPFMCHVITHRKYGGLIIDKAVEHAAATSLIARHLQTPARHSLDVLTPPPPPLPQKNIDTQESGSGKGVDKPHSTAAWFRAITPGLTSTVAVVHLVPTHNVQTVTMAMASRSTGFQASLGEALHNLFRGCSHVLDGAFVFDTTLDDILVSTEDPDGMASRCIFHRMSLSLGDLRPSSGGTQHISRGQKHSKKMRMKQHLRDDAILSSDNDKASAITSVFDEKDLTLLALLVHFALCIELEILGSASNANPLRVNCLAPHVVALLGADATNPQDAARRFLSRYLTLDSDKNNGSFQENVLKRVLPIWFWRLRGARPREGSTSNAEMLSALMTRIVSRSVA